MPKQFMSDVEIEERGGSAGEWSPAGDQSPAARPPLGPPLPGLPGGGALDPLGVEDLPDELIDQLLAGVRTQEDLLGGEGLVRQLTRRFLERALAIELTEHLGYEPGEAPPGGAGNSRNGHGRKTLLTGEGAVAIRTARDRNGTFEPQIVAKGERRLAGLEQKIVAMYARGMTVRDIQAQLEEIYDTRVSPDLISRVTDAVLEDARAWQNRPLDEIYPIVYMDALQVKIREGGAGGKGGVVRNHACYLAIGVRLDGRRETLGMWFQQTEGAKFWLAVLTELRQRGLQDVLIACVDGLAGFTEAIEAVYPRAWTQTCIVHMVRGSLKFVPYKDRRRVAADLKAIYTAADADEAALMLDAFAETWDHRFPMISASWRRAWEQITPFLAFPADVRRIIYTTNTIEALNRQIRKTIKTRGHFPTEDAARKLLYLAITNAEHNWRRAYNWSAALVALKIHFGDRLPDTLID
jgi:putative transposase